jgi:phenylpyruvate tautomerase PptA (4-oxalocrotonate tautomerase family)
MKIAPGSHTISWTASPGLATPTPQIVDVVEGQTTVVNGEFRARGFLRVTQGASPVAGTVFVNDVPMDDWGIWLAVDPGQYKVSWGPVAGFDPPATQYADVYAEQLATVVGDYVPNAAAPGPDPASYGLLRVTTSVDLHPTWGVWSQVLVDGIPRDEWGLAWLKIAPGSHTISWTASPGLATPEPVVINVVAGEIATVNGEFKAEGFLRVTQGLPSVPGTVFVNGIPRNDWGMWMAMLPGDYTVSWGPVPGMVTPASEIATVVAEASVTVTKTYTPIGEGVLAPSVLVVEAAPESSGSVPSLSASSANAAPGPSVFGITAAPSRREEAT